MGSQALHACMPSYFTLGARATLAGACSARALRPRSLRWQDAWSSELCWRPLSGLRVDTRRARRQRAARPAWPRHRSTRGGARFRRRPPGASNTARQTSPNAAPALTILLWGPRSTALGAIDSLVKGWLSSAHIAQRCCSGLGSERSPVRARARFCLIGARADSALGCVQLTRRAALLQRPRAASGRTSLEDSRPTRRTSPQPRVRPRPPGAARWRPRLVGRSSPINAARQRQRGEELAAPQIGSLPSPALSQEVRPPPPNCVDTAALGARLPPA